MDIVTAILWALAALCIAAFLHLFLIPFIQRKWILWRVVRQVKKMYKKYDAKTQGQLKEIADIAMKMSKDEKL